MKANRQKTAERFSVKLAPCNNFWPVIDLYCDDSALRSCNLTADPQWYRRSTESPNQSGLLETRAAHPHLSSTQKSRLRNKILAAVFRLRPDAHYFIPKDCDVGRSIV